MIVTSNSATTNQKDNSKKKVLKEQTHLKNIFNDENQESQLLRPQSLSQYVGQEKMVRQLGLILESAKIREKIPEHILFYGPPGLGKTTIASLIAGEMNASLKVLAAPSLQKTGDLVSLLLNLEPRTVLFIDEIHRLRAPLEETLYSAMEDGKVDLLMGKGQGASVARLDLSEFMLIGATTQLGKLSKPLKDRFPSIFQLEPYTNSEILDLVERNTKILKLKINQEAKLLVCRRSRGTPRIANNLLKRLLDFQTVHKISELNDIEVEDFLKELGIFQRGLTTADLTYMRALQDGSLGLKTLGGRLLEETETLELVTEPYLIYLGFLDKSSEGRKLTAKGLEFITQFDKTHRYNVTNLDN